MVTNMKYQVVYISNTGNTEKIAKKVFEVLPGQDKDIVRFEPGVRIADADIYFIGFWIKRGTCSMDLLDFISELHDKKIVLFGTCGMGTHKEYYKELEDEITAWIADDSECLGTFICQGKMPMEVRNKYENMLGSGNDDKVEKMLQYFDSALTHPDKQDLENVAAFIKKII
ncbi:MAG: flavodoxin family protein [Lachnospiraceae bacterium]|nr:flavodoxin family protein [Lachnospiraceae bacterium]